MLHCSFWCVFSLIQLIATLNASGPNPKKKTRKVWVERVCRGSFPRSLDDKEEEEAICVEREMRKIVLPSQRVLSPFIFILSHPGLQHLSPVSRSTFQPSLESSYVTCSDQWDVSRPVQTKAVNTFVYWPVIFLGVINGRACPVKSIG